MNDQLRPIEVTTNGTAKVSGTAKVTDGEPPKPTHEGRPSRNAQSVDEHLAEIMETIRTWDWRADSVEAGPSPSDATTVTVSGLGRTETADVREDLEPPASGPPPVQSATDHQTVALEPMPQTTAVETAVAADPTADTQKVVLEPTRRPVMADPALAVDPEDAADDASSPSVPRPKSRVEPMRRLIGRLWSHRWTKVTVLFLAAAVTVLLIIWVIRLANDNSSSGDASFAPPSTSQPAHTAVAAPLTAAQLNLYKIDTAGLQRANAAALKGFAGARSTTTTAELESVITAYRSALNLYDSRLHFIQWPASMQPAIQADHAQFAALMNDLQSYSTIDPTGTRAWLSGFHSQSATTQTADNQVRTDLGLASSSSFP
jgi:hypothetical protein